MIQYPTSSIGLNYSCYDLVLNKSVEQLKTEQKEFIRHQLNSIDPTKTNTVVFIGHQPLIYFRFDRNDTNHLPLLDDIYDLTKQYQTNINFHYICADFHNFEEGIITKNYSDTEYPFRIQQLIFGTGGSNWLYNRTDPTKTMLEKDESGIEKEIIRTQSKKFKGYTYSMMNRYTSIKEKEPYNIPSPDYSLPHLKVHGYGVIIIDENGLTYEFIPIKSDDSSFIPWKNKYLKYKNKYLTLKNNL